MNREYPWMHIESGLEPLSSDLFIIKGEKEYWIFDAGNNDAAADAVNALEGKKNLIISHFHEDHIGNIRRVKFDNVYVTKFTSKYVEEFADNITIITETTVINDGDVSLSVIPMPSSHSKGSLALELNGEYVFMGDSAYGAGKDGKVQYNVSLLKAQTELLKKLDCTYCVISHEQRPVYRRETIIRNFDRIYLKREKDSAFIIIDR